MKYTDGNVSVSLDLSRFDKQFEAAQQWLGDRVLQDCRPYTPMRTGSMAAKARVEDKGRRVVFEGDGAKHLYRGFNLKTGQKLRFSNPMTTDHWFDTAKTMNLDSWVKGVEKKAKGK